MIKVLSDCNRKEEKGKKYTDTNWHQDRLSDKAFVSTAVRYLKNPRLIQMSNLSVGIAAVVGYDHCV